MNCADSGYPAGCSKNDPETNFLYEKDKDKEGIEKNYMGFLHRWKTVKSLQEVEQLRHKPKPW